MYNGSPQGWRDEGRVRGRNQIPALRWALLCFALLCYSNLWPKVNVEPPAACMHTSDTVARAERG